MLAVAPCSPNSGSHMARTRAATTGMYSGRQPAITAEDRHFLGGDPAPPHRLHADNVAGREPSGREGARTASSVGATIGSPSVHPWS